MARHYFGAGDTAEALHQKTCAGRAAHAMEAELLRDADGQVLFMEAGAELVTVLMGVLHAPLGSVILAANPLLAQVKDGNMALSSMASSVMNLRSPIFHKPLEAALKPLDLDSLYESARKTGEGRGVDEACASAAVAPKDGRGCLACMRVYGAEHQQQKSQWGNSCSVCTGCYGAAQREEVLSLYTNSFRLTSAGVPELFARCCVACAAKGLTGFTTATMQCTMCQKRLHGVCQNCSMCNRCGIFEAGFRPQEMGATSAAAGAEGARPEALLAPIKETVRFLVTNELEVFENSSMKAVEIILPKIRGNPHSQPKSETVHVTPEHIRLMLAHALLGKGAVLDAVFPSPARAADSLRPPERDPTRAAAPWRDLAPVRSGAPGSRPPLVESPRDAQGWSLRAADSSTAGSALSGKLAALAESLQDKGQYARPADCSSAVGSSVPSGKAAARSESPQDATPDDDGQSSVTSTTSSSSGGAI